MASRSSTKEKKNSKKHKYEPLSDSEDDSDSGSSADTTNTANTVSVSATSTTISSKSRHHIKLKRKLTKMSKHLKRNRIAPDANDHLDAQEDNLFRSWRSSCIPWDRWLKLQSLEDNKDSKS